MYFLNVLFSWYRNYFIKFFSPAFQHLKHSVLESLQLTVLLEQLTGKKPNSAVY